MSPSTISLELTPTIQKQVRILKWKDPRTYGQLRTRLKLLVTDPFDPKLRTHKLKGRLQGRYAFPLSSSLRVVFRFLNPTTILLIAMGSHDQVYR